MKKWQQREQARKNFKEASPSSISVLESNAV